LERPAGGSIPGRAIFFVFFSFFFFLFLGYILAVPVHYWRLPAHQLAFSSSFC
jgi:hypothetical protein